MLAFVAALALHLCARVGVGAGTQGLDEPPRLEAAVLVVERREECFHVGDALVVR